MYLVKPISCTNSRTRHSYADDIRILGTGQALTDSAVAAQREVNNFLHWANENVVLFDLIKTRAVQFPGHGRENPVGITLNSFNFEPVDFTRWFSLHLDYKIIF